MRVDADDPRLSVAILTFNGETYLRQILLALRSQEFDGGMEVLVVDSGSMDGTLAIVAEFPEVRLFQIPNTEFGHGKTRNYAASLARGEFLAFLTHDAIPSNPRWANELIAPFALSEHIVGVLGSQIPRPQCFPLLKYEITGLFAGLGSSLGVTVSELRADDAGNEALITAKAFYSDVNSAVRRKFLIETLPYRDVRYAEDQLFGRDVIEAGYAKAYAPAASVVHSNDLTLSEYGPRMFDETVALREIGREVLPLSSRTRLRLTLRGVLGDSRKIIRDHDYSFKRKCYWLLVNPLFHVRKWKFHNLGARLDLSNRDGQLRHSLEARRKTYDD